jgi:CheY-like chemotaxis protein
VKSLEGAHILVVDDDPDTLEVECALLEIQGCKLTCVESVEAAVAAIRKDRPDLVITDCAMPLQDGFDLLHRIKENAQFDAIPTLMVTAHANPELRDRALHEGFDAFLTKPVDPARLVKVVEKLIIS